MANLCKRPQPNQLTGVNNSFFSLICRCGHFETELLNFAKENHHLNSSFIAGIQKLILISPKNRCVEANDFFVESLMNWFDLSVVITKTDDMLPWYILT